jgi:hypothetical protein
MKNNPDPDLSGGAHLFNEIKKRTPKSRETIPLTRTSKITSPLSLLSHLYKVCCSVYATVKESEPSHFHIWSRNWASK